MPSISRNAFLVAVTETWSKRFGETQYTITFVKSSQNGFTCIGDDDYLHQETDFSKA